MNKNRFLSGLVIICIFTVAMVGGSYLFMPDELTVDAADNDPKILYVGEDQPYQSIQDAVHGANIGDTVFVKSGIYTENIQIDKDYIIIQGENINTTLVGKNSKDTAISICNTTGVTVKGLSIQSAGDCISIKNSADCSIKQCKIESKTCGINVDNSSNKIVIDECDISGAISGYGIKSSANAISILNSNIYNNNNGIYISPASEVLIENNQIYNHKDKGCELRKVSELICKDNNFCSNSTGIFWSNSSDEIKTNGKLINNELFFNKNTGIYLTSISNCLIENNYMYIQNASDWPSISAFSMAEGIVIWGPSSNNTISKNVFSNYDYDNGLLLDYYSCSNKIYWNDFINCGARDNSKDQTNMWDLENRGNFWSKYSGIDKNGDGIGDTPHVIEAIHIQPKDNYPLMKNQYMVVEPTLMTSVTATPMVSPTSTASPTSMASPTSTASPTSMASPTSTASPTTAASPTPTPSLTPTKTVETTSQTITVPKVEVPAVITTTPTPYITTPTASPCATPSMSAAPTPTPSKLLADIKGHWAKECIDLVISKGIMSGKSEKLFAPNDYTTRAECAKVTIELLKKLSNKVETVNFSDISQNDWFYSYVYSAYNEGLMIGNPDGTFSPNSPVTRQDLALIFSKILVKYCSLDPVKALNNNDRNTGPNSNMDISTLTGKIELPFNDTSSISEYALNGVATVANYGLFTGKPGNLFDPKGKTTRAELATILYKLITKYELQ